MFSRRKHRHLVCPTDVSSTSVIVPDVTADATARYENNSHGGTTWYDLMPTPANGTDGGAVGFWPNFNDAGYVTIGQPAKLNFTGAFTITAWCLQTREAPPLRS